MYKLSRNSLKADKKGRVHRLLALLFTPNLAVWEGFEEVTEKRREPGEPPPS